MNGERFPGGLFDDYSNALLTMLHGMSVGVLILDHTRTCVYLNSSFTRMTGYKLEDIPERWAFCMPFIQRNSRTDLWKSDRTMVTDYWLPSEIGLFPAGMDQ